MGRDVPLVKVCSKFGGLLSHILKLTHASIQGIESGELNQVIPVAGSHLPDFQKFSGQHDRRKERNSNSRQDP